MLKICSDGRKAALDLSMVGVRTSRPGKAGAVIANVARIYHANSELVLPGDPPGVVNGGFQIVFCGPAPCSWRPADVEQREGRALRPGHLNPAVELYQYVTEKSFDSFMCHWSAKHGLSGRFCPVGLPGVMWMISATRR
jgi:hypothetical protein